VPLPSHRFEYCRSF